MKKRLLLFLCIFTLLLSTAAQAEDVTAADTSVPAPSAEKADTLSPLRAREATTSASRMWTPRRGITTPSPRCTNTV